MERVAKKVKIETNKKLKRHNNNGVFCDGDGSTFQKEKKPKLNDGLARTSKRSIKAPTDDSIPATVNNTQFFHRSRDVERVKIYGHF